MESSTGVRLIPVGITPLCEQETTYFVVIRVVPRTSRPCQSAVRGFFYCLRSYNSSFRTFVQYYMQSSYTVIQLPNLFFTDLLISLEDFCSYVFERIIMFIS